MKKVMLLAAMLAMVLVAVAPAFAQAVGGDVSVQYTDCSQVQDAAADQGQFGDASADASGVGTAAAAEIAQDLSITQAQVNACLGEIDEDEDESASASASSPAAAGSASAAAAGGASAAAAGTLPETGGASLLALGAGALLVAGGLVARRIVR